MLGRSPDDMGMVDAYKPAARVADHEDRPAPRRTRLASRA